MGLSELPTEFVTGHVQRHGEQGQPGDPENP
jgi:hypothetical protein